MSTTRSGYHGSWPASVFDGMIRAVQVKKTWATRWGGLGSPMPTPCAAPMPLRTSCAVIAWWLPYSPSSFGWWVTITSGRISRMSDAIRRISSSRRVSTASS